MHAYLHDAQAHHNPKHFMASGVIKPNPETPNRVELLKKGALDAGCTFEPVQDFGLGPISAIHTPEYLKFLNSVHKRWSRIDGNGDEVIPNIHPANRTDSYPKSVVGQAGYHQADTACPIGAQTWDSAYWSAQTALAGAQHIASGGHLAYSLCRPPGHHAFGDLAGGFCFLNNSAIAAQSLTQSGKRVAILDVDVHHGNGTQGIFYNRSDVLTVSIHAHPERFYPFYWGYSDERGAGDGLGYNLNLPLDRGLGNVEFLAALDIALDRIALFGADVIVVALGLDASIDDPFQALKITPDGFEQIANAIASHKLPTLLVQEGGYVSDMLGTNLTRFLLGSQA